MTNKNRSMGFSYFSSPEYLVSQQIKSWMPVLQKSGAAFVIFGTTFDLAVPEEVISCAQDHDMDAYIHFNSALPSARTFNDAAFLLDLYNKWGVQYVIFGDQPNTKQTWPIAGWHYETLVDQFLDRFIPLANHAVRIGLKPVLAPLQPGGDYWDCAFLEILLDGLIRRKMENVLNHITLSSYGYTFQKPLSWGEGGPERWPGSKPYLTSEGQEDQIGFNNFEWVQATAQRITGEQMPVIILDAGRPGPLINPAPAEKTMETFQKIIIACCEAGTFDVDSVQEGPVFNDRVIGCSISLDTLKAIFNDNFSVETLEQIVITHRTNEDKAFQPSHDQKILAHYLLLPSYASGVSDAVLNKVRPLIKTLKPTVGFSVSEAMRAAKVTIFPDPFVFKDDQIDQLRAAGCQVEILPESGIEIATRLQG